MKTPIYNLIVQSEEKNRTILETLSFALLTLSVLVSIWHAAVQPVVVMPGPIAEKTTLSIEHRA